MTRDEAEHIYKHAALTVMGDDRGPTDPDVVAYIAGLEAGLSLALTPEGTRLREAFATLGNQPYMTDLMDAFVDAISHVPTSVRVN